MTKANDFIGTVVRADVFTSSLPPLQPSFLGLAGNGPGLAETSVYASSRPIAGLHPNVDTDDGSDYTIAGGWTVAFADDTQSAEDFTKWGAGAGLGVWGAMTRGALAGAEAGWVTGPLGAAAFTVGGGAIAFTLYEGTKYVNGLINRHM